MNILDDDINKIAYQMDVSSNIELELESDVFKKLKANQLFIKLYSEEKRKADIFIEYANDFFDDGILNLVDVGWKGTIQDNIQKSIPKSNIKGYYLGLIFSGYSSVEKENKIGVLFSDYPCKSSGFNILYRNFDFFEKIFVADHGPVIGYEKKVNNIVPILDIDKKHTNIYRFVKKYQENMIDGYIQLLEIYKQTCYLPNEMFDSRKIIKKRMFIYSKNDRFRK